MKTASTAWHKGDERQEGDNWGDNLLAPRDCCMTIAEPNGDGLPFLPQESLQ